MLLWLGKLANWWLVFSERLLKTKRYEPLFPWDVSVARHYNVTLLLKLSANVNGDKEVQFLLVSHKTGAFSPLFIVLIDCYQFIFKRIPYK